MMQLDRRAFVATGSASLLAGCATVPAAPTAAVADCAPLPPVQVDAGRVIRTVAGLRPYRPSGFAVRAEPLGDKRLVHNYGHGGAGITLSWGSSRLATLLGLQGHSGPVAVIGAGAMGLTTARLVQEAGFPVTIYTAEMPPETTSNIAGGQFNPTGLFRQGAVTEQWLLQFRSALDYSWRRFQIMVGDDYGVRWLPTYDQTASGAPQPQLLPTFPAINRALPPAEHPFPLENLVRYDTLYVETGRFLRQLLRDIHAADGRTEVRRFETPADIAALPERLVFNCTGLGARALFGDQELVPVRGQLAVLLPQPEVRYAFTGRAGYMFPRADGILLGGTYERGEWNAEPQPGDIARIIANHQRIFSAFRCNA